MDSLMKCQMQRKSYLHRTSLTKRTMIWLSVILPKPTAWIKKLKRKRSALEMHGLHIRITLSPKRWLPSVQFSSFSYPYFALTVMLVCAPAQLTSAEMSKFTSRLIARLQRTRTRMVSQSLDKLRKATMSWVLQPLKYGASDKYLDKKFWTDSSDSLMYQGKAPELSATRSARMPAFL